jgi:hypothetical protein
MFKVIKLEGDFWVVFLVNRYNDKDRYRVTPLLDNEGTADKFLREFNRIERESK